MYNYIVPFYLKGTCLHEDDNDDDDDELLSMHSS